MKFFIKSKERSFFILELPVYRGPRWKNVAVTMVEKAKIFVLDAGKVIMVISLILWALSTYGPSQKMAAVTAKYDALEHQYPTQAKELQKQRSTALLQNSYAGTLGKAIEPAIKPLGYDWKIGIALITSFAAREVFVGTMSTIYSVGQDDSEGKTVRDKMQAEINPDTGLARYTPAVGWSLMIFYAFAMQCMSTLAVVKRETGGWKWPVMQFFFMSALAYCSSLIIFQLMK